MGHPENTNSLHVLVFTWVACNTSFILRCTSFQLLVKREEHIKGARMLIRVANNISKFPSRKCMNIYNYFWASCAVKHKCIVFLAWVGGGEEGEIWWGRGVATLYMNMYMYVASKFHFPKIFLTWGGITVFATVGWHRFEWCEELYQLPLSSTCTVYMHSLQYWLCTSFW